VSAEKKREMIELVRRAPQPKRATIAELGLARSTFYRWQRCYRDQGAAGLTDRKPEPGAVWNRLRPEEQTVILETALQQPDLSPRELACHVTDHAGFTVSEATVYRVLKRHGLNRTIALVGFPAGKEFRVKTTAPNQLWQSDASYFFVVGWGWYYSILVLDDFSVLYSRPSQKLRRSDHEAQDSFQGTATMKDGAIQTAEDSWTLLRGTGKLKGAKGKGTCKGTGATDGSLTWECAGEYTLASN